MNHLRLSDDRLRLLRSLQGDTDDPGDNPKRSSQGPVSASRQQRSLWIVDQMLPADRRSTYHVPLILRFRGDLDIAVLQACLTEIVRRHQVLRTVFDVQGGIPVQVIKSPGPVPLPTRLVGRDHLDREVREEVSRDFDLSVGPLLRALLLRADEPLEHLLVVTVHHIVFDGASREVFLRELTVLYTAFLAGQPSPLPELRLQYAEYAARQHEREERGGLDDHLRYWQDALDGAPQLLDLPTDRPRPPMRSPEGSQVDFVLPRPVLTGLRNLARTQQCTLFMVLLAAFQVLLSRLSGQSDICVGAPVTTRSGGGTEALIGFFVNTLVLRGDLSDGPTFRELLERTRSRALDAFAHQDVPFELLVERLRPGRTLAHNPLYQVALVYQTLADTGLDLAGLEVEERFVSSTDTKGDLVLDVQERPDALLMAFGYRIDLYEARTIELLAARFQALLASVAADPEVAVDQVDVLLPEERESLASGHDASSRLLPRRTLAETVCAQAERTPAATAVVCDSEVVTYQELAGRARALAAALRAAGVGTDQLVGVLLPRGADAIGAFLAVLISGAGYLPLDPAVPAERLRSLIADAGPVCVVTDADIVHGMLAGLDCHVLVPDWISGAGQVAPPADVSPADVTPPAAVESLAYVVYTSGSTGRPKGVEVSHSAVMNQLAWLTTEVGIGKRDVVLARTSFAFDVAATEVWAALTCGATVCIAPDHIFGDLTALLEYARHHGVTVMWLAPSLLAQVPASARLESLRYMITGGEPLATDLAARVASQWSVPVGHQYGPTETTVTALATHYDAVAPGRTVPLGLPVWNTRAYVLDVWLRHVPAGTPGELYIGGVQVARGYRHCPAMTAERFLPDVFGPPGTRMYRTGDICRWRPDGQLEFVKRDDDQLKIRGFRVEPGEIEAALRGQPGVRQAAVLAHEYAPGDVCLVAYVLGTLPPLSPTPSQLREALATTLPDYLIPSSFVVLDSWPTLPNGKLDRRALPEPERASSAPFVGPRNPHEQLVADIWSAVLRVPAVGVDDDFFELGGHSLHATQVVALLRDRARVDVSLRTVFQFPTVSQLARFVAGKHEVSADQKIFRVDRSRYRVAPELEDN